MFALWIPLLLFFSGQSQDNGIRYLQKVMENYSGIKDYTVDVRVHFDIKDLKAPDMDATIYYKEPDKVRIKSNGLFMLPREVGLFNPRKFNPDNFYVSTLDTLTYEGNPAVHVSLVPKKESGERREIILTIDEKKWLVREISTPPSPGRNVDARIVYGSFSGFELPVEMDVDFEVTRGDSKIPNFSDEHRRMSGLTGNVQVFYSNYKINTGLSDDVFKKHEGER